MPAQGVDSSTNQEEGGRTKTGSKGSHDQHVRNDASNTLLSYTILQDAENTKGERNYKILHGSGESVCKARERIGSLF